MHLSGNDDDDDSDSVEYVSAYSGKMDDSASDISLSSDDVDVSGNTTQKEVENNIGGGELNTSNEIEKDSPHILQNTNSSMQDDDLRIPDDSEHSVSSDEEMQSEESGVESAKPAKKWLGSIKKVLASKENPSKRSCVLSKQRGVKKKPKVAAKDDETQSEKNADDTRLPNRVLKLERNLRGRKKPSLKDRNKEQALSKVAVRGVVQLFNAVRQHELSFNNDLESLGNSELKKDKLVKNIDKSKFLKILGGENKKKKEASSEDSSEAEVKKESDVVDLTKTATFNIFEDQPTLFREDFFKPGGFNCWDKNDKEKETKS